MQVQTEVPKPLAPIRRNQVQRNRFPSDWREQSQRRPRGNDVRVEFLVRVPPILGSQAADERVFISGNHARLGQWRPDGLQLTPVGRREFHGAVDLPRGVTLEYKITRGTWDSVEQSFSGTAIPNRTLTADAGTLQLITVEQWADDGAILMPTWTTRRGQLHHHHGLKSEHLGDRDGHRSVAVYLPPGYDQSPAHRYPVLYMQDGQNLFDPATASSGVDWRAGETADRLIADGRIEPLIIVGVYNTIDRLDEYAPMFDANVGAGGKADQYVRFIVDEVKPMIDGRYRTRADRENTAIGGASLGAIAALHACKAEPRVFGKCAAISPSLWWGERGVIEHFCGDREWLHSLRLWIDMGTAEGQDLGKRPSQAIASARQFVELVRGAGLRLPCDFKYEEVEGAAHDERAWAARFDRVLSFLFSKSRIGAFS